MSDPPREGERKQGPRAESKFGLLLPRRDKLHAGLRIAVGALGNCLLAIYVLPHVGHMQEMKFVGALAATTVLQAALPLVILLILLPVFLFGRDVPRLLAIGLSVLPCYLAVTGIIGLFESLR